MKKIVACICALSLTMGIFAGCKDKAANSNANGDKINLRFSFWEPSTGKEMETALRKIEESYEKAHPDVNIELVPQAASGYQDWIKTQMSVDDLPEIELNYAPTLIGQYQAGAVINIKDALEGENPYTKKIWRDSFIDGTLDAAHEYRIAPEVNIPLFQTGVAMYYNKDTYKELGLKVPKNWDEFIANCKAIEKAGKIPNAFMGQKKDAIRWLSRELMGGVALERWLADDTLNLNGDSYFSKNEVVKAIDTGAYDITKNKEHQEDFERYLELTKEYAKYSPNASGLDEASAKTLFLSGKATHLNSGSWDIVGLLKNDEINFEPGVFRFPLLTKKNSEFAGKGMTLNAVQTVAITSSVNKQEGAKEAAIDFLMYLTAPEQYSAFVNETYQIPSINDVDVDPIFDAFIEDGYPLVILYNVGDSAAGKTFEDIFSEVAFGKSVKLTDKDYKEIQESIKAWAVKYMETNKINAENDYGLADMPFIGENYKK
ncbi:MAG: extracellular solute-binding protein [Clostridia bacterium]|nr:extracellular solute-binding protein [Clostridia bacterium]